VAAPVHLSELDLALAKKVFDALERLVRKAPPSVLRLAAIPIGYQMQTTDRFLYESSGMAFTAFAYVANNGIQGDYAEFGVYRGRGIIDAYYCTRRFGLTSVRLWALDSFEGLPKIEGEDMGGPFSEGQYACSRPEFERNVQQSGVDMRLVHTVEGRFDISLADHKGKSLGPDRIAIAWIDCDLYESTVPVLDYLTNRLVDGAVLIFDDWYCFSGDPQKGEQLACAEWLAAHPEIRLCEYRNYHWAGKSFIFRRVPV
jgi:O-methyltransferase